MVKIDVDRLSFSYGSVKILDEVSIVVQDSEIVCLVGPNGSGKTTLIKCIDRILEPRGSIFLDGRDIEILSRKEIARIIGYVPQSNSSPLSTTVFDTVLMGRRPHIGWQVSDGDLDKVARILELLHLEDLAMRDYSQLSGGQKQKVLIARALVQEPSVLLLDEPTSNLDMRHQLEVMEIIRDQVHGKKISAIMAIHDLNLASRFSDRLAMLVKGKIFALGTPSELLNAENMAYVFGIKAIVMTVSGRPYIVAISSLNEAYNKKN